MSCAQPSNTDGAVPAGDCHPQRPNVERRYCQKLPILPGVFVSRVNLSLCGLHYEPKR